MEFITENDEIDIDALELALNSILNDAKKANKGALAASRRFRVNTIDISKHFLSMRNVTPKSISK